MFNKDSYVNITLVSPFNFD